MIDHGLRVRSLVFDDDEAVRALLVWILESRGHEVFAFDHPSLCDQCRCYSDERCADIIVSDVGMPRHTGVEFLENQARRGCRARFAALMSGGWSEDDLQRADGLDCKVFRKPLDLDAVGEWLDECERRIDPGRMLTPWFLEGTKREVDPE